MRGFFLFSFIRCLINYITKMGGGGGGGGSCKPCHHHSVQSRAIAVEEQVACVRAKS